MMRSLFHSISKTMYRRSVKTLAHIAGWESDAPELPDKRDRSETVPAARTARRAAKDASKSTKGPAPERRLLSELKQAVASDDHEKIVECARRVVQLPAKRPQLLASRAIKVTRRRDQLNQIFVQAVQEATREFLRSGNSTGPGNEASDLTRLSQTLLGFARAGYPECIDGVEASLLEGASGSSVVHQLIGQKHVLSGDFNRARDSFETALSLRDCDPEVQFLLAEVLDFLGSHEASLAAIEKGLSNRSRAELLRSNPRRLLLHAGLLMRKGDMEAAWQQSLNHKDRTAIEALPSVRLWDGRQVRDEKLLLVADRGVGDEIRYASCYRELKQAAPDVMVSADPRLLPLLSRSFPDVEFIPYDRTATSNRKDRNDQASQFQVSRSLPIDLLCFATQFASCGLASDLPAHFRPTLDAFPKHDGYLVADESRRKVWRERLDSLGTGLKVGVAWRSSNMSYKRRQHYFTLEQLLPVLQTKGVHFVNLQYDDCSPELDRFEKANKIAVHRWEDTDLKDDLESTAALIKELDVVISPHIMVKELAGAVGTRALFMVPAGLSWIRWRAQPDDMADIWHPSMTHIHSHRSGDKEDVVHQTAAQLKALVEAHGPAKDWQAHTAGFQSHRPKKINARKPSGEQDKTASLTNAFGETFIPASADGFATKREYEDEIDARRSQFQEACGRLFGGEEQPRSPKGVMLICGVNSYKQLALTVMAAHGLRRRGWAVADLMAGPMDPGPIEDKNISYFRNLLVSGSSRRKIHHRELGDGLRFDWEIDWPNRVCRAEGINFYGIMANRLGKECLRYAVDIGDPPVAARFERLLQTCDAALAACLDIEEKLGKSGLPVRITGFEPNYPPTGVFKVYCAERGHKHGIEFVEIRQAYEKYFRGGRSGLVSAIDVQNVTRKKLFSAAALSREPFEQWFGENGQSPEIAARTKEWATQNRSGHSHPTREGEIVLERVRSQKAKGGKVACLYGCIPFDFGHPWIDEGPAHRDLIDWYNHTVLSLRNSNVLLLIKPHPSEADFAQFGQPEEFFVEMLRAPPPPNCLLLGHRWLNNSDLLPHLDFAIIWRGSVATELALCGIPAIVCAPHSMTECALDLPMPSNRSDYEEMLQDSENRIRLTDKLKRRASTAFEYYRTEIMIPYPFGWIGAKHKEMGPPALSEGAVRAYLKNGHPSVDEICDRIIS